MSARLLSGQCPQGMFWFVYLIEYTTAASTPASRSMSRPGSRLTVRARGAATPARIPPLRVLATEAHPDRSAASRAEYRIKQLSAEAKRAYAQRLNAAAS
ncbi:MAG: hypothetical protein MZW92_68080 [Comamonadaceae bacterium]|nr:hypothetical protein [Comamonadaceae bacterium]